MQCTKPHYESGIIFVSIFHAVFIESSQLCKLNTVGPLYPLVLHPWVQPTAVGKYLKKNSRNFPKAQFEFVL